MPSCDHKSFLTSLLNRQLHFTVSDGRVFKGTLMCTDKDGSAVLDDTYEYRGGKDALILRYGRLIPGRR